MRSFYGLSFKEFCVLSQITSVYLAPMEGLADPPLRKVLCPHGGYDWCFSEFIRVTDEGLSEKTLVNDCPELLNGGYTQDGWEIIPSLWQMLQRRRHVWGLWE